MYIAEIDVAGDVAVNDFACWWKSHDLSLVELLEASGPSGYPVFRVGCDDRERLIDALAEHYGGEDDRAWLESQITKA